MATTKQRVGVLKLSSKRQLAKNIGDKKLTITKKLSPQEAILKAHSDLLKKEPNVSTLAGAIKGRALSNTKVAQALRKESILYTKHLEERLKLLEKYAKSSKPDELPHALRQEWLALSSRNHEFGNASLIAQAHARAEGPIKDALKEHADRMRAFYIRADERLTAKGLTFAKVEAREEAA